MFSSNIAWSATPNFFCKRISFNVFIPLATFLAPNLPNASAPLAGNMNGAWAYFSPLSPKSIPLPSTVLDSFSPIILLSRFCFPLAESPSTKSLLRLSKPALPVSLSPTRKSIPFPRIFFSTTRPSSPRSPRTNLTAPLRPLSTLPAILALLSFNFLLRILASSLLLALR